MSTVKARRSYHSPLRQEALIRGQQAIVAAAGELFVDRGYARTTIDQIAAHARVSRKTVFAVGSKAHLLALVRLDAIEGDQDEPLSSAEMLEKILATPNATDLLERFAHMTAGIARRWGPLHAVMAEAAASDPEIQRQWNASRDELHGCARLVVTALMSLGSLRDDLRLGPAADIVWLLIEPSQYQLLVVGRHWSHRAFEQWQAATLTELLIGPQALPPKTPSAQPEDRLK